MRLSLLGGLAVVLMSFPVVAEDKKEEKTEAKKDRKEQRPMIADIRIERTRERVTVVVTSSRVGAIIGKKGEKIDKLTKALEKLTRRHIEVKTVMMMLAACRRPARIPRVRPAMVPTGGHMCGT